MSEREGKDWWEGNVNRVIEHRLPYLDSLPMLASSIYERSRANNNTIWKTKSKSQRQKICNQHSKNNCGEADLKEENEMPVLASLLKRWSQVDLLGKSPRAVVSPQQRPCLCACQLFVNWKSHPEEQTNSDLNSQACSHPSSDSPVSDTKGLNNITSNCQHLPLGLERN